MTDTDPNETEAHLYCLECGYNLRGLAGDPVRCPECGEENAISNPPAVEIWEHLDALIRPARLVRRRLVIAAVALFAFLANAPVVTESPLASHATALAVLVGLTAAGSAHRQHERFRSYCEATPRTRQAFARQRRIVIGYSVTLGSTAFLLAKLSPDAGPGRFLLILAILGAAAAILGVLWRRDQAAMRCCAEALYVVALSEARSTRLRLLQKGL